MLPWPNPGPSRLLQSGPSPHRGFLQRNELVSLFLLADANALCGEGPGLIRGRWSVAGVRGGGQGRGLCFRADSAERCGVVAPSGFCPAAAEMRVFSQRTACVRTGRARSQSRGGHFCSLTE